MNVRSWHNFRIPSGGILLFWVSMNSRKISPPLCTFQDKRDTQVIAILSSLRVYVELLFVFILYELYTIPASMGNLLNMFYKKFQTVWLVFRLDLSVKFKVIVKIPSGSYLVSFGFGTVFIIYIESCVDYWFLLLGNRDRVSADIFVFYWMYSIPVLYYSRINIHRITWLVLKVYMWDFYSYCIFIII